MENALPDRTTPAVAVVGARYDPVTVAGRIARIDADLRWLQRRLSGSVRTVGYRSDGTAISTTIPPASGSHRMLLIEQRARLLGELGHWRKVREWQIAAGRIQDHGPATISPGDSVKIRGRWHRVLGTYHRTLRIDGGGGRARAVAYRMVSDHAPGDEESVD
ncbi:hypothetical protein [Nakamurella sp.]|uniref:hypothetical protein n=1 Tax=Nakamurella sp. TaxID=1869182 RepID=UPI003784AF60